ncbi:hypothetical protein [Ileibacterium valens]|uniref:hypothetical protein n=1 Tax=Ileibacterium valens TaxID=1862668 RepID=UPI00272B60DD|nr:hypothetical protein [Ileibacterium valens]
MAPNRYGLSLIWFTKGWLEYPIPLFDVDISTLEAIEISMEICAEISGYNNHFQSDLTFSLNGIEAGTWTSPGDYGDRKGKFTPAWWTLGTEYGDHKILRFCQDGVFMDNEKLSDKSLFEFLAASRDPEMIRLRIECREDAVHPGGLNLFGRHFGDYDQNMIVRLFSKFDESDSEDIQVE